MFRIVVAFLLGVRHELIENRTSGHANATHSADRKPDSQARTVRRKSWDFCPLRSAKKLPPVLPGPFALGFSTRRVFL